MSPEPISRGRRPVVIFLDALPLGTVDAGAGIEFPILAGIHEIHVKFDFYKSDIVRIDLPEGESIRLACGMKPLITNRFFRIFEKKFLYFATPLALIAFAIPGVVQFIEKYLK